MKFFSDKTLVKYCKAGIKKFCNQIFKRYSKFVFNIAYKNVNDYGEAEDITQETFIRVFKSIKAYREEASLKNWLGKIVTNYTIQVIRSKAYKNQRNLWSIDYTNDDEHKDEHGSKLLQLIDNTITGDTIKQILSKEGISQVREAISRLSDKHRSVIVLLSEGHCYEEIAEITSVSVDTVKSRIHYARKKLVEILSFILARDKKEPQNE